MSELKSATRDGVKLSYADTGAGGPPLVLIHGWCCDHTYWREQVPAFAPRHRVLAVDLRGHGESDKPEQEYTIAAFVDDIAWLVRELGLKEPVLIGHSMGGAIIFSLLRKHPQLARAAVIVDALPLPLGPTFEPIKQQVLAGLRSPQYREVASGFIGQFLFRAESPAALREEVLAGMTSAPQHVMASALAGVMDDANVQTGALPVPTLFLRAATLPTPEDAIREAYPGMRVQTLDAAHFLHMEKPQEFNDIVTAFLDKVR